MNFIIEKFTNTEAICTNKRKCSFFFPFITNNQKLHKEISNSLGIEGEVGTVGAWEVEGECYISKWVWMAGVQTVEVTHTIYLEQ